MVQAMEDRLKLLASLRERAARCLENSAVSERDRLQLEHFLKHRPGLRQAAAKQLLMRLHRRSLAR